MAVEERVNEETVNTMVGFWIEGHFRYGITHRMRFNKYHSYNFYRESHDFYDTKARFYFEIRKGKTSMFEEEEDSALSFAQTKKTWTESYGIVENVEQISFYGRDRKAKQLLENELTHTLKVPRMCDG
jgi:hypothetical protein